MNKKNGVVGSIFICSGAFSFFCLFCLFVFNASASLKSVLIKDSLPLLADGPNKTGEQKSFAEPNKNFLRFSPEMTTIQQNSVLAVSPPVAVDSKVLGSLIGGVEPVETEVQNIFEYVVEQGETLSSIASKFNISLDTILWANNLNKNSNISPGQKLTILPVSGVIHLVKKGDTLSAISGLYKADLKEVIAFNNLANEDDIFIGDIIIVPGGKMPLKPINIPNIPLAESYFIFPCEGKITQGLHGVLRNAVDIANAYGVPVVAAAGGTIQRTGAIAVGGKRITILHPNGVVTYYGHLSSILVSPGQIVTAGEIIGYMGQTGFATGPHLHFEVRGAGNFLGKYLTGSYLKW